MAIILGAHAAPGPAQDSEQALCTLEVRVGRQLGMHRVYRTFADPTADQVLSRDVAKGRVPLVSWRPGTPAGVIPWAELAAGGYDWRTRQQADFLATLPGPVLACLHHEPELAKRYGSAAEYVAAWRRWAELTRDRAGNVRLCWITSPAAFRDAGAQATAFWPGDQYVDWTGVNAFNWFGCAPGLETHWVPLGNFCRSAVAWATTHGKPLAVAEWGSVEDPAAPGRKAKWIGEALAWAKATPAVAALCYLHAQGSCPWWLDSSIESMAAFSTLAADSYAQGSWPG